MATSIRADIAYGRTDEAYMVARDADRALEGCGVHVSVQGTESGDTAVWLVEHGDPLLLGWWFLPGEQLVVMSDGTWRIEPTAVTP